MEKTLALLFMVLDLELGQSSFIFVPIGVSIKQRVFGSTYDERGYLNMITNFDFYNSGFLKFQLDASTFVKVETYSSNNSCVRSPTSDGDGNIYFFGSCHSSNLFKFTTGTDVVEQLIRISDVSAPRIIYQPSALARNKFYFFVESLENSSISVLNSVCLDATGGREEIRSFYVDEKDRLMMISDRNNYLYIIEGTKVNSSILRLRVNGSEPELLAVKLPIPVHSNGILIGEFIVFISNEKKLVLIDLVNERATVEHALGHFESKRGSYLNGVYVPSKTSIYLFVNTQTGPSQAGVSNFECSVYTISIPPYLIPSGPRKFKIEALEGTTVTVRCQISGNPGSVSWKKDGKDIGDAGINLTISRLEIKHRGSYSCTHRKYARNVSYSTTVLQIFRKSELQGWRNVVEANEGDTTELECKHDTEAPIKAIAWYKNGDLFRNIKPSDKLGLLTMRATRLQDSGIYRCVVTTVVDSVDRALLLTVVEVKERSKVSKPPSNSGVPTSQTVLSVLGSICSCIAIVLLIRKCREKVRVTDEDIQEFLNGSLENVEEVDEFTDGQPYDRAFELLRNNFELYRSIVLGKGQFGCVIKGTVYVNESPRAVAFKTTKSSVGEEGRAQLKCLLAELKVMIHIGKHPFVVQLIGAYTRDLKDGIVYVALEFCTNGSLESFLRKSDHESQKPNKPSTKESTVTVTMQTTWCHQISQGMQHLESKNIIHADLAARNVLLAADFSIRITDFGLSRKLDKVSVYVKKGVEPLPLAWMALECLEERNFSSASDVWSFGVTVWEIYSMGVIPYSGDGWNRNFVDRLKSGERLPSPQLASTAIYEKILECWRIDPSGRPKFNELTSFFREIHYRDNNIVYA